MSILTQHLSLELNFILRTVTKLQDNFRMDNVILFYSSLLTSVMLFSVVLTQCIHASSTAITINNKYLFEFSVWSCPIKSNV